jgi:hypothetical protein
MRVVAGVQPLAPMATAMTPPRIAELKMEWRSRAESTAANHAPNCADIE